MYRFLCVLGLGVAIGMLIAPEKGSVIRAKITGFIDELTAAGRHLAEPAEQAKMHAPDEPGSAPGTTPPSVA